MEHKTPVNPEDLTIIIPAYNEEEGIGQTLDALMPVAAEHHFRIIVVDDGSTDGTYGILQGRDIQVIRHPYNKGYGASIKTGIKAAETGFVGLYDADGQHNPEDLVNLWKHIDNYDMLVGMRGKDSHQDWIRRPGKWILRLTANFLTGRKIPDLNSGLRIIRRLLIAEKLHLFSDSFSFSTTSTVALMSMGFSVGYYPIKVNRRFGKSTVRQLRHGPGTMLIILRMVVLFNPLKVFLPVSIVTFLGGITWGIAGYIIVSRFPNSAILLSLMGMLLFFMGLISDQISTLNKK